MKSNGLMVTALIAVSALFASSYYTWWRPGAESPQEGAAIDIAVLFLKNGPTFKFDGITDSIKVVEVLRARTPTRARGTYRRRRATAPATRPPGGGSLRAT